MMRSGRTRTPFRAGASTQPFALAPPSLRATWSARLTLVARALGRPVPFGSGQSPSATALTGALGNVVDTSDRSQVWLALAALSSVLPDERAVVDVARACEYDGCGAILAEVRRLTTRTNARLAIRIVTGGTLVDVNQTVTTDLSTGIQRVTHATVSRWLASTDCTPVAWTPGCDAIRELTPRELARFGPDGSRRGGSGPGTDVLVPWRSTVIVPELAPEHERNRRLLALGRYSGNRTGVIGFDCVPLTSAETTPEGFASVFFDNLAAVREFDRVAAISAAAAQEYEGWRSMLGAVGLPGPTIGCVPLAEEPRDSTPAELESARARLVVGGLPLVLVVGSHEPRKNHLAVLHAAELCWRRGSRFSLSFVGGRSWADEEFRSALTAAQAAGRPVETVSGLPEPMLWAAYRVARFTVFPSLNEGFGLPVAESLAAGTPVITSSYGSMRELGAGGGAVLVDPRRDHEIADAMQALLDDDDTLVALRAQALARPRRSWDDYAAALWEFFTAGPARH